MIIYAQAVALLVIVPGCLGKIEFGKDPPSSCDEELVSSFKDKMSSPNEPTTYSYTTECTKYTCRTEIRRVMYIAKIIWKYSILVDTIGLDSCKDLNRIGVGNPYSRYSGQIYHTVLYQSSPTSCTVRYYSHSGIHSSMSSADTPSGAPKNMVCDLPQRVQ